MPPRRLGSGRPGHHAPPWWPEGEPWPPQGSNTGRTIGRRFAILALAILVLAIIAIALINHTGNEWSNNRDGPPPFAPLIGLFLVGSLIFFIIRRIRRSFRPLADVIDAAERLAQGDYSVRVPLPGPGQPPSVVGAFNTMAARLEANEKQRRQFLSDVTHELRTPLAVVQGTIEGMRDDVYPRDDAHLVPLLERTRAIGRLLDDLQTLANTDAGALSLHRTETDLAELLHDVVQSYEPAAEQAQVTLTSTAQSAVEAEIDPFRMRQVLDNLVTNALRYTPANGTITLGVTRMTDAVVVTVRDSGSGMEPEVADRMFERFHKSADSGGSGLGLAIARGIVVSHGGTIVAKSAPGHGTTITIRIPHDTANLS